MERRLVREGMYYASKLGMNNGDYAFIAFELDPVLVERYVGSPEKWFRGQYQATKTLNDEEKKEFNKAYKSMLVMVSNIQQIGKYNNFTTEMKHRMSQPPFCSDAYVGFNIFNNVSVPKFIRPVSVSIYSLISFNVDNRSSEFERKTYQGFEEREIFLLKDFYQAGKSFAIAPELSPRN